VEASTAGSPTTAALLLYEELKGRGVTIEAAEGGTLRVRPQSTLSEEDKRRLKKYKGELVAALDSAARFTSATSATPATYQSNPDTYAESVGGRLGGTPSETPLESLPPLVQSHLKEASRLGLVARWSSEFGFISIHDPTTGEWHDLATKDCPEWAKNEAFKRKELRKKQGISRLLKQGEMEQIWEEEQVEMWEHTGRGVDERGLVYEDYLEKED
jgi:hypothetical protein